MAAPSNVTFDLQSTSYKGDSAKSLNDLQADLSERQRQLSICLFSPSQVDTIAIKKRLGIPLTPEDFRIEINKRNSYLKRMLFSMLYEIVILHEMVRIQLRNLIRLEKLKNEAHMHGAKEKGHANLQDRTGGLSAHHQRLLREVEHGHSKINYALWKDTETHSWLDGITRDDVRQAVAETLRERFKIVDKTLEHFDEVLSDETLTGKQRESVEKVVADYKQHLERSTFENMKKFAPKFRELVEDEESIQLAAAHSLVNEQLNANIAEAEVDAFVFGRAQSSLKELEITPQPVLEEGSSVAKEASDKLSKLLDLMPKMLEQAFGDDGEPIDSKLLQDLCQLQDDLYDFKRNTSADLKDKIDLQIGDLLKQAEEKDEFSTVLEPLCNWERNIHVSEDVASHKITERRSTVDAKSDHPGVRDWKAAAAHTILNGNGAVSREDTATAPTTLVTQDDAPDLPDNISTSDEVISKAAVVDEVAENKINLEKLEPVREAILVAEEDMDLGEDIDKLEEISKALDDIENSEISLGDCKSLILLNFNMLAQTYPNNESVDVLRNEIAQLEFIDEDELFPAPTAQLGK